MNMYSGTFEVVESNGQKSTFVEQPVAIQDGGSCGAGCGCMGKGL
jgi:hypothetical protein